MDDKMGTRKLNDPIAVHSVGRYGNQAEELDRSRPFLGTFSPNSEDAVSGPYTKVNKNFTSDFLSLLYHHRLFLVSVHRNKEAGNWKDPAVGQQSSVRGNCSINPRVASIC
ncbi:hypothetical protein TcasGA2_TC000655 [Tribolium castaneum]|uniref:Uncharacterized protein n=1 Tax=Tribolium castaneum TaxID=7070 RepID=D6W917_TRICA|nr:hypothetical protein TcasGA2_TC000655 [Tribolium castaneum]